jgi:uncharacterized protein with FMN-binding domain
MKTNFIILILTITTFLFACEKSELEHEEALHITLSVIDFNKLTKGEYQGYYAGGMYGWRENECKIQVDSISKDSSRVIKIELIRSVENRPQSFFDELYNRVIEKQSLQIDAVSGATLSSKAHLKAIENALLKSLQSNP